MISGSEIKMACEATDEGTKYTFKWFADDTFIARLKQKTADAPVPAMTIQQARIEALRTVCNDWDTQRIVASLSDVERLARFIMEGVK